MRFELLTKQNIRYASAGIAALIIAYGGFLIAVPIVHEFTTSFAMKEFRQFGIIGTYRKHFFSFQAKMDELAGLEAENTKLKNELALLDQKTTLEEAEHAEKELASMNAILEKKVMDQGGSETARLMQTLSYEVPSHLMPPELYTLALAYFRKQEFEKVVVILDYLFKHPDGQRYQTGENYLMSGIAWYHLKNFVYSKKNILEANQRSHVYDTIHRHAVLWEAIIEKGQGRQALAQAKLLRFVGQYPHSVESSWINGGRSPARQEEGSPDEHPHAKGEE